MLMLRSSYIDGGAIMNLHRSATFAPLLLCTPFAPLRRNFGNFGNFENCNPSTPHAPRPTSAEHPATQRLNVTLSHKCADTSAIRTPNAIAPVRRPPRARFGPFPHRRVLVSAFTASRRRRTPPRRDVSSSSDRDETDAIATASAFPRARTHVVRARCMPAFELNVTHRSPSRSRVTARVDDVSRRRAARAPTDALGTRSGLFGGS